MKYLLRSATLATLSTVGFAMPATADAATVSMRIPKRVKQWANVSVAWQGDVEATADPVRVVSVYGAKGRCPAQLVGASVPKTMDSLGDVTVLHVGGFQGAAQTSFTVAGSHRLCGYITVPDQPSASTLVASSSKFTVTRMSTGRFATPKKAKDGDYVATAGDINGGDGTSSLRFTISGGNVTAVSATGIPNTSCETYWPGATTPVQPTVTSNGTTAARSITDVFGALIDTHLPGSPGDVDIKGGTDAAGRIHGSFTVDSTDGSCHGGFGFTARRQ